MTNSVSPSAFDTWAERIKLKESLRAPLKLVYCDRRTPTWAARECGLSPATITRAVKQYPFGLCPCCGTLVPLF
ncbi:MAG: hypothetical protein PHD19_11675 [Dechloromonas sp.]|nr:hypothetical protein [Dechloromonas sp.]